MASFLISNTGKIVEINRKANAEFLADLAQRLNRSELGFVAEIKSKQMSGQQGKLYTNVITGNLRRKWFNEVVPQNQSVKAMVWSTAPYAPHLELHDGEQAASAIRIPDHTVQEHYRQVRAHGPAKTKRGKAPQASILVRAHTVRAHWQMSYKRLRIGQAWQSDFMPKMRQDITAAVAAHFPVR